MTVRKWGGETLVNTNTPVNQNTPAIAVLANGGFVVTWSDADPAGGDGNNSSIKMQLYDASGNRVGGEVLVNTTTAGSQFGSDVTRLSDGSFVIAWTDGSGANGTGQDIRFRRFEADGTAIDPTDRVAVGAGNQQEPSVVALAGGGFAVGYNEFAGGFSRQDKLIRFDAAGTALDVTAINIAVTADNEEEPDIAVLADGSMVAVYHNSVADHIFMQRIAANGSLIGGAFQISNNTGGAIGHDKPKVAALANGGFVVTWEDDSDVLPDASGTAIHAQLFDAAGTEVGAELIVNTATASFQESPEIVATPGGGFAIVWFGSGIRGQLFDEFGARLGGEFVVSTVSSGQVPAIAALPDGRLVVTWDDIGAVGGDGSFVSVRMQIIDPRDGVVTGTANGETLLGHELLNDEINGLGGDDALNGLGGSDDLYGGDGNDTYVVGAGDRVFELFNAGTDLVQSAVSFALGANVENLTLLGAAANATGNTLGNVITGNAGVNIINGGGGIDSMRGLAGDDRYYIDHAADAIVEGAGGGTDLALASTSYQLKAGVQVEQLITTNAAGTGAINLFGNEFANSITGNSGSNIINGKGGSDTLRGYLGNDFFIFDTALGAGNIDTIADFNVANDTIRLENAIFTGLANGVLAAAAFGIGAAAADASDRIIYNSANGKLLFDDDGTGAHAAIQFASVSTGLAMTNADFFVV
jgi:hypothetical protein